MSGPIKFSKKGKSPLTECCKVPEERGNDARVEFLEMSVLDSGTDCRMAS